MRTDKIDPILLEILWNRLISIVNEQAAALIHASFTTVVREAEDLSAGVFDRRGYMLAQAVTGTPGHINTMANFVRDVLVPACPIDDLQPGDALITNDPWDATGHLFDFTVVSPVFYQGRGIGWFANTCHAMDIGGLLFGADAREVFEEGINIPLMHLFRAGEPNQDLIRLIRANVRVPDQVIGDLYAQRAGNEVGVMKLALMLQEYELEDLSLLSELILQRSEAAMREAIAAIPDGEYTDETQIDGFDEPLTIRVSIAVDGDQLLVDFGGTSGQVDRGINVVYNYTHAYTTYPLKCAIGPGIPNNEGSFRPIRVIAPARSLLNCEFPAPVGARHLVGHFISQPLFGALSKAIPDRVIADGSAGLWNTALEGETRDGNIFSYVFFSVGGMGARPSMDGLSATSFPSGIKGVPAEVIEAVSPMLVHRRALRPDSGGPGRFRGGLGQELVLESTTGKPVLHSCMYDRTQTPARGFLGGGNGAVGELFLSDSTRPHPKRKYFLQPGQRVTLRMPGGGGYYPAWQRDPDSVLADVREGLVSEQAARSAYRVAVDAKAGRIDEQETRRLRSGLGSGKDQPIAAPK